jgi:transcriptional regulator of acetoin/glycerol metabolism
MNVDCHLLRVARPVLDERERALAGCNYTLVLTDAEARVLARWGTDSELEHRLTATGVFPGCCLGEAVVGTNAAALTLETGGPVEVLGAEHFSELYVDLAGAGAPIVHPVGSRLMGTLSVGCRREDATPLLMPWLLEVVREVERRLRVEGCVNEHLLLEAFLAARRDSRHPIVCLNDQTILSNSAAARLLGTVDQALLWEQASRAIHECANEVSTFVLSDGQRVSAHCQPIFDGLSAIGAKIEIRRVLNREPRRIRKSESDSDSSCLGDLVGGSLRWRRLCEEVLAAKASGKRFVLVGEPGTGKLAILRAAFAGTEIDVFDGGLSAVEATSSWLQRLNDSLQDESSVVVLRHLEVLDQASARAVATLVERAAATVVGTVTVSDGVAPVHGSHLGPFDISVSVPALRERLDDLRDLVHQLAQRHSSNGGVWRWMPDAIQTLSRVDWPDNVRSLETVVRHVVSGRIPGYIDARGLPAYVRAAGSRRRLSRLEHLEAAAIAEALERSRGNKLEAAKGLGIARSTLYRRMRSLGLDLSEANY